MSTAAAAEASADDERAQRGPATIPARGLDPREVRASERCAAESTRVVIARGDQLVGFPELAEAVAELDHGDLLWLCDGGHTSGEGVRIAGKRDLTIAAQTAVLIGEGSTPALEIQGGERILLRGLRVGLAAYSEEGVEALRVVGVRGFALESSAVMSEVGAALALVDVRPAEVRDTRLVGSRIGASAERSEVSFASTRFAGNASNLAGQLAGLRPGALGEGNRLGRTRGARFDSAGRRAPKLAPEATVDLAAAFPAGRTFPVITWRDGERYAVLETALMPEVMPAHPSCDGDESSFVCSEPIPHRGPLPGGLDPASWAKLSAITSAGPCALEVGEPVSLETSGCESSMTLALPLAGCAGAAAPLVTGGTLPAGLRWAPRVEIVGAFAEGSLPPSLRPWLVEGLRWTPASLEALRAMGPMTRGDSGIAEWSVDLAHERWETRIAGAQIPIAECEAWGPVLVENVLRPAGGEPLRVKVPTGGSSFNAWGDAPWTGALELGGYLVAWVTRGETETGLIARRGGGGFAPPRTFVHWADHDECLSGRGPLAFGALCEP